MFLNSCRVETGECRCSWQSGGAAPWHLPPGLPKQPSIPDTVLSLCPAVNQCHGRISSSISFVFRISGCKWKLQPPPSVRTAGGEERGGNSRSMTGALSSHSSGHPNSQEACGLWRGSAAAFPRESFAWKANECHGPSLAPVKRVSFPLCSTLLPSPCLCFLWIWTFLSTSVNTHCGKLPWEHHFLVDLPLS